MHYVISDIHGCYDEFMEMLSLINFNDTDILYVLGDCIDRGPYPIKTLLYCLEKENIHLLCGNHEWFLVESFPHLVDPNEEYDAIKITEENYYAGHWICANGGETTVKEFFQYDKDKRNQIIKKIKKLPLFFEVTVNNKNFVMIHGGISNFRENISLKNYDRDNLIWSRLDVSRKYYSDKSIIVGHTPTSNFGSKYENKIVESNNNFWIDCGCAWGHSLGCMCLETEEKYIVPSRKY